MNNKGFTLVEVLAMITILGILMVVTVPNISKIIENNRDSQYKNDAVKMVDKAKILVVKNNIEKPTDGNCIKITLDYLNTNDDFDKSPNGGHYKGEESFVLVKRKNDEYEYYVRLVEKIGHDKKKGIELENIENISSDEFNGITAITGNGSGNVSICNNNPIPTY